MSLLKVGTINILLINIIFCSPVNIFANNLLDFTKNLVSSSKEGLKDSNAVNHIPGYSQNEMEQTSTRLNGIAPGALEEQGALACDELIKTNPDGGIASIVEGSKPEKIIDKDSYKDLKLFTISDEVMQDPASLLSNLTSKSCKEVEASKGNKPYYVRKILETKTEENEYMAVCEAPITKIECDRILKVECSGGSDCSLGGLEGLVQSDMKLEQNGKIIIIGTKSDNYWGGYCAVYDRDTEFNIKNQDMVTEFRLVQAGFDDHIQIKINDHVVYVGPHAGNDLRVEDVPIKNRKGNTISYIKHVTTGSGSHDCELNTNWVRDVNIDLLPYLIEGRNKISMRVIVSGGGEGWMKIIARKHCCEESWNMSCEVRE